MENSTVSKELRIALLITANNNFGNPQFYNAQELGLAKALNRAGAYVTVYKLASPSQTITPIHISGCNHATIAPLKARTFGVHGFVNTRQFDPNLDILVYFADTQLAVPSVFHWTQQHNVIMIPYIGTIDSHSTNPVKRWLMNLLTLRNIEVYRQCRCVAKTPEIADALQKCGVSNIDIMPVGLDLDLMNTDYTSIPIALLKSKYGYSKDDKILLFIGRMTEEKQPLRMIDLLRTLQNRGKRYHLLMVGTGELKKDVISKIKRLDLLGYVKTVDRIPNANVWELYRISDCFVNLNQQEIFGMAILEAMYYGRKVVAWKAPGPSYIIENGVSGFLVNSNEEAVERIINGNISETAAYSRVVERFTWGKSVQVLLNTIGRIQ
jgi:1,2-diacylglycerol 3-alpha-glucosyltransferase